MTISPDGVSVRFNTEPKELFNVEQSGAKSNTVRIIDPYEAQQIRNKPPTKIFISCQQEIFCRTLTDIHLGGEILEKVLATFSWANTGHVHTMSKQEPDPYAHTMSLDEQDPAIDETFAALTVSKGTLALLQCVAHGRTMNAVIRELLQSIPSRRI